MKISKPLLAEEKSARTRRNDVAEVSSSILQIFPIFRILSLDFFGTKGLGGWTSDFKLGAKGTGTDAQDSLRERLKEVLASEDKPVAEGVAEMRRMEG